MGKKVKCSDCGFLAMRRRDDLTFVEADREFRTTGRAEKGPKFIQERPICFARKTNFIEELSDQINPDPPKVKAGIQRERECDGFTEWQLGFSPKEHQEMIDRKWMLEYQERRDKDDREFREHMAKADRDWRESEATKTRYWQGQQAKGRHRWDIIIFAGLVTGALFAAQIIAAYITRGGPSP